MKKNYITMQDIARKLDISRSTVSFVLNDRFDKIRISDEVRLKVKKTAQEMGYCRNAVVQSLVSGRTRQIAFVSRGKSSYEFQSRALNGLIDGLTQKEYSIRFFYTENEKIEETFQKIVEQRIEGIVTYTVENFLDYFLEKGKERNIPVAVLDHPVLADSGIYIKSDDYGGIKKAVKYLKSIGHTHIGYFGLDKNCGQRHNAFIKAIDEFGLKNNESDNRYSCDHMTQRRMADELLSKPANKRPTAYCCASDYIAAILEFSAARNGLSIPRDLSIIGFSNLNDVNLIHPGITTVNQFFEKEGLAAANLLIKEIESKNFTSFTKPISHLVETELLVRDTTAPLSQAD